MHYRIKISYIVSLTISFLAIINLIIFVCSIIPNLNKENTSTQNNDAKTDISPFQIFLIVVAILLFALMILCFFHFYWNWSESQRKREEKLATLPYAQRYVRVNSDIELKNRERQRTPRTESCVGPSDERTEICNPGRKNKHESKSTYKSKNERPEQNRRQHKHENKRGDESEDQQMSIRHKNVAIISDEDIKESVVPTLELVLPKSAKTSASSYPGPSRRKSGVSVSAIKITHEAEVYATVEKND